MKWFLARLSEPSTWAGFASLIPAVVGLLTVGITPAGIGAIAAGVTAIMVKEKGTE